MTKILFVDDEAPVRRAFKYLHEEYFGIETAESADHAMAILEKEEKIGVVISDIKMPKTDGIELAKMVKNKFPHKKIIINTANMNMQYLEDSINKGHVDAFFEKVDMDPDSISKTRSVIARLIQEYNDGR